MTGLKRRDTTEISDANITDRRLLKTQNGDSTYRDQENIFMKAADFGKPQLDSFEEEKDFGSKSD